MPNLTYTVSPYQPFTKILSANINQDKTDIQNRLNWSGSGVTTGLDGTNIQSNSASAETAATLTLGGVTYTAVTGFGANGNSITVQYTSGGIAGSEVVTVSGFAITVQVQSGVSTVTQVRTAVNANAYAAKLIIASGTSSSTVSSGSATALAGGVQSGGLLRSTKLALDAANFVLINDSSGKTSSEAQLAASRGGTGLSPTFANQSSGDVIQVNAGLTGFTLGPPTSVPAALRLYQFYNFS